MKADDRYDVVVAGGGPAAVSAAILLSRRRRRVAVCDHGWIEQSAGTRTDLADNWEELQASPAAVYLRARAEEIEHDGRGFVVACDDGKFLGARGILLGAEEVPGLPGIHGTKLFHGGTLLKSPFREPSGDRGQMAGVLGAGEAATGLALRLQLWSADVTVYTHGGRLQEEAAARLEERGVRVVTQRLTAVEGTGRQLERIRLSDGSSRPCDLLYYTSVTREPVEATLPLSSAAADGVFTLAHASTNPAVATAEGFRTGEMIHRWLLQQEQRAAAGAPNH